MKIMVNDKTYTDSQWSFNMERGESVLILTTAESISEVASAFDGDDTISVYDDNDVEICEWHVHTLLGIYEDYRSHTQDEARKVYVTLVATALTANSEEMLSENIDENMEAILELGELIADMDDANLEIEKIKAELLGIPKDIIARFDAINNVYNDLADRVSRLENDIQ